MATDIKEQFYKVPGEHIVDGLVFPTLSCRRIARNQGNASVRRRCVCRNLSEMRYVNNDLTQVFGFSIHAGNQPYPFNQILFEGADLN